LHELEQVRRGSLIAIRDPRTDEARLHSHRLARHPTPRAACTYDPALPTAEFLELSDVESALVDLRLALSRALKVRRVKLHLSQCDLARRIESSQSRVAKMEAADPDVSIDLLLRGLLATGATRRDVAKAIEAPMTTN
jgi:hypothetical protein